MNVYEKPCLKAARYRFKKSRPCCSSVMAPVPVVTQPVSVVTFGSVTSCGFEYPVNPPCQVTPYSTYGPSQSPLSVGLDAFQATLSTSWLLWPQT